ncbi:MAG TPA: hypothetical protein VLH16_00080, partial [Bacteroidales bacterium]|nr:hypothetical protein [Bacteroidales bacterium]
GGGFGKGIHNILEAAVYSKPLLIGPRYRKFREATDLAALGGAWPIADAAAFAETVGILLSNQELYETASQICSDYVRQKRGAAATILKELESVRL